MTMPTPGSREALALGCTCPVEDNNYGRGKKIGKATVFWAQDDCPVDHWGGKAEKEAKE